MVVVQQVVIMALLIVLGMICYWTKLIGNQVNQALSSFVLMVANPMVVFLSYQTEFQNGLLKGLGISFLLAAVCFAVSILISMVCIRNKRQENVSERFACIYSNCGFMGIPLVSGLYGGEGVLYLTSFMTIFNLLVWTHGVVMMNGKVTRQLILGILKTPVILATAAGLVLFLLRITLPAFLLETIGYVGGMNTPLAMIVAGVTIAQTDLRKALKNLRLYYICFLKLLLIPAICIALFFMLPLEKTVTGTCILAVSCPAAATGTLFAIRYYKNSVYAAELFAATTVFSMITLPVVMWLFERIAVFS